MICKLGVLINLRRDVDTRGQIVDTTGILTTADKVVIRDFVVRMSGAQ